MDYQTYYSDIAKPFFAPEPWVFGLAWGIIYPLIALASVLMLYAWYKKQLSAQVLAVFAVNMIANFVFTPLQLGFPEAVWATLDIFIVLVTLAYIEWQLWQEHKVIFFILLPYLFWGSFATALQVTVYWLNFM